MLTLLHISDLHFGPHYRPQVGEDLLRATAEVRPDIIVASGDFTQRAKRRQYADAREFLGRLPAVPTIVVPGNHDVPLYRVHERLFTPYALYRQFIRDERDWTLRYERAVIVALNTTSPLARITNGRIRRRQLEYCRQAFQDVPSSAARIVVVHHAFARPPDYEGGERFLGARKALSLLGELGVELVLAGHHHRAYVSTSRDVGPMPDGQPNILLVQAGTATSARGRAREHGQNSFNVVRIDDDWIHVEPWLRPDRAGAFAPASSHRFPRAARRLLNSRPDRAR
jgi:3',5'-cyclic AMP phosphodiesterase CpdA